MSKPLFQHDCDECRFLGTGRFGSSTVDYYVCGKQGLNKRTLVARFGNEGPDYTSGTLFQCVTLTDLDRVALYNGLELTPAEEQGLLAVLARMIKNREFSSFSACREYSAGFSFGNGNVMFSDAL